MVIVARRDLSLRAACPPDPLLTSDIEVPYPAGMRNSLTRQIVPDVLLQAVGDRVREHLRAENQILVRGVLAPVMADAADRRHEHHRGRKLAREPLRVVAGAARHANVL